MTAFGWLVGRSAIPGLKIETWGTRGFGVDWAKGKGENNHRSFAFHPSKQRSLAGDPALRLKNGYVQDDKPWGRVGGVLSHPCAKKPRMDGARFRAAIGYSLTPMEVRNCLMSGQTVLRSLTVWMSSEMLSGLTAAAATSAIGASI